RRPRKALHRARRIVLSRRVTPHTQARTRNRRTNGNDTAPPNIPRRSVHSVWKTQASAVLSPSQPRPATTPESYDNPSHTRAALTVDGETGRGDSTQAGLEF